ncbi:MAG: hypothetical protein E7608_03795 [Ruminococcaceae bacterium]|nr:hypothetical protein [Oscillospiraceae bacterium]
MQDKSNSASREDIESKNEAKQKDNESKRRAMEEAKRAFGRALAEAFAERIDEELAQATDVDASVSDDHKRKMNRIFRENAGTENVPYPEVDDPV